MGVYFNIRGEKSVIQTSLKKKSVIYSYYNYYCLQSYKAKTYSIFVSQRRCTTLITIVATRFDYCNGCPSMFVLANLVMIY